MKKRAESPTYAYPLRRIWSEEGVPLLMVVIKCDLPEDIHPRINAYYHALTDALLHHCEHRLFAERRAAFLSDENPRRRYTHRRISLTVSIQGLYQENTCLVNRTLSQDGRAIFATTERFSSATGNILPAKKDKKQKRPQLSGQQTKSVV